MPIYSFQCSCGHLYDVLRKYDQSGQYADVACPACGGGEKKQQICAPAITFGDPVGTSRWGEHDYRAKHQMQSAFTEREAAGKRAKEETGYVGRKPYREFDDLNRKDAFGPVK